MSEQLKKALVDNSPGRSLDAQVGSERSPLQNFIDRASAGPYSEEELYTPEIERFLSDPSQATVITCGRNEHKRGNLIPTLEYAQSSTIGAGNVIFIDARSTDGSAEIARAVGVNTIERNDALEGWFDIDALADLMRLPKDAIFQDVDGFTPMRKGIDVMIARLVAMQNGSGNDIFIDSDLMTIPDGRLVSKIAREQVYHPIQSLAKGFLDLDRKIPGDQKPFTLYTGSGDRNNETIMGTYNTYNTVAFSPFLNSGQRQIARAFYALPSTLMHLLTGELIVSNQHLLTHNGSPTFGSELDVMNATGQATESARTLSQSGFALMHFGDLSSENLADQYPLFGNVRRGEQLRIDEPQTDDKEWWMIAGILPQFIRGVADYCIQTEQLPHQLSIDDYPRLNEWLSNIQECSYGDKNTQTRVAIKSPMERAIPPISLLIKEGIIRNI
ncbi:hypothetical protein CO051_02265 [Candidatus Roizmanbacteria bacterium CG_4_9_14_0_2_um_filter_39_13]|uniref:Uncharacterized protein n=2 Tax=Candidatus Roizmaniibacteriota TaxID=1752723 RepID=A0A2M8F0X3_9BACT|nr:MAG: hypothetical protein COY15_02530 [Candidatus Roizmanbacteria bacterium CG_4_10_14_0_2_um_filter_39_12]PJC32943.1 MAG: hypothetical protein CO051_02265 [Candidatus Roizmanbacteria bacterium CG_4_9_14_0_2_um_filter_39_13]PJE61920.1 MAG: hypothetical protein COU87_02050 [Candidatus Roizmanbacteria bacterium CG10_big_fil_rev_8_21_14_0_10_39_12]